MKCRDELKNFRTVRTQSNGRGAIDITAFQAAPNLCIDFAFAIGVHENWLIIDASSARWEEVMMGGSGAATSMCGSRRHRSVAESKRSHGVIIVSNGAHATSDKLPSNAIDMWRCFRLSGMGIFTLPYQCERLSSLATLHKSV